MEPLPPGASAASQRRYALACELARLCPSHLGQEIALTGSTSLGLADDHSDIELNFWGDTIPSPAERRQWLAAAGATDITLDEHQIADGSFWVTCRFQGIWIEAGWQSINAQEELLRAILAGDVVQHERLLLAFVIQHAVPLRDGGLLSDLSGAPGAVSRCASGAADRRDALGLDVSTYCAELVGAAAAQRATQIA